jgi:peptidoglycan-N-acetylglucosamine deacetylase
MALARFLLIAFLLLPVATGLAQDVSFSWPNGNWIAVSLSFDDARPSQVDVGIPLLDRYGAKATFFVVPGAVEQRVDGWKRAAAAGHEIGNHSVRHPCSGNFPWARERAVEDYSLEKMREELAEANRLVAEIVGVTPETFAYPCGQKFVGRGKGTRSYVPLVADLFRAGRGWMDEAPNDPEFVDLAQVMGVEMDGLEFEEVLVWLERARENGSWLVLAGHEIGEPGRQTTRVSMLEKLIEYALEPESGIWLAPVGTVAAYIIEQRGE